jgi:hypothetical protein
MESKSESLFILNKNVHAFAIRGPINDYVLLLQTSWLKMEKKKLLFIVYSIGAKVLWPIQCICRNLIIKYNFAVNQRHTAAEKWFLDIWKATI